MLPSIRALVRDLQISVITTKRAYEELEKEGLIYSVPGKGFYIKEPNYEKLKEAQVKEFEYKFDNLIQEGKKLGLELSDMQDILKTLYEDVFKFSSFLDKRTRKKSIHIKKI